MSVWTVTGVAEAVRDWNHTASGSPMKAYKMDLQGADGSQELLVEWSRKAESAAPVVGQVLEGEIESGTYGRKFKKAQTGGFSGGGGSKEYKADPAKQAGIAMESSIKSAINIVTLAAQHSEGYTLPDTVGGITEQVRMVARKLYEQILEASEATK